MLDRDEPTPGAVPTPASSLADTANGSMPRTSGAAHATRSAIQIWILALTVGLIAGVTSWAIGEATNVPERGRMAMKGENLPPPSVNGTHNAIFSYGALGAALGLAMGLAGGLIGQSFFRAGLASLSGLFLGGGAGVITAWLTAPFFYKHVTADDLTYSLIVHSVIWATVGGVAGFAFACGIGGRGRLLNATVGGVVGALLATVIYEFAGGILAPFAATNLPVSLTWQSRLAARLLVAVLVSSGIVLSARSSAERDGVETT
jgi:hypothetical protein